MFEDAILTAEQINESWGAHPTTNDTSYYQGIARAQHQGTLKAVVTSLFEPCTGVEWETIDGVKHHRHYPGRERRFCPQCWLELRQAAGLESKE